MSYAKWAILALVACSPAKPAPPKEDVPLTLPLTVDLVPAASLEVLVDAHPKQLLSSNEMRAAAAIVFSQAQFDGFAVRYGGVDLRTLDDLVVATYPKTTLVLARTTVDPARIQKAFSDRADTIETVTIEQAGVGPRSTITRYDGTVGADHEEVMVFGTQAVGVAIDSPTPLRVASLFAQGKLKKALPALFAAPLDQTLGLPTAPFRLFFPGPFAGESEKGLAGLLRATTAVAVLVSPSAPPTALAVKIVLYGGWKDDAKVAGERLLASLHTMAESSLGKLCGIDHPVTPPTLLTTATSLTVDLSVDSVSLANGIRAATSAQISEIMKH